MAFSTATSTSKSHTALMIGLIFVSLITILQQLRTIEAIPILTDESLYLNALGQKLAFNT